MKQLDRLYIGYLDDVDLEGEACIFVPLKYPRGEVIKEAKKFFLKLQKEDRELYEQLKKENPEIYTLSYEEYFKNCKGLPRFNRRGKLEKGYVSNCDICIKFMQGKRSYQRRYKCWVVRLKEEIC